MAKKLARAGKQSSLPPSELRWICDPEIFDFETTRTLESIEGIIGQERALKALRLGVDLYSPGYNIFVTGLSGTGKATTIQKILERINPNCPVPMDYAYVNNFACPEMPRLLVLPAGVGQLFSNAMESMIDFLIDKVPSLLEDESYTSRRKLIMDDYAKEEKSMMLEFEGMIKKDGFSLGQIQMGQYVRPDVFPLIEGEPIPIQQLGEKIKEQKITQEKADQIVQKYQDYALDLQELFKKGLKISQTYQDKLIKLEQETVSILVDGLISDLKEKFNYQKVHEYLSEVRDSVLNSLEDFKATAKPQAQERIQQPAAVEKDPFRIYMVNVILDNSSTKQCPVIIETSPSYTNLFGSIEKSYEGGGYWSSDFMSIRAGSLLRANGGYLVLNAFDTLTEPGVWKNLKRVLQYRKLEIQDFSGSYLYYLSNLKPEPIEMTAKVIFVGSDEIYHILSNYEEDFKKIFKIRADFDYEMHNTEKALLELAGLVKKLCEEEKLLPFDKTAIAAIAEYSARYSGSKNKLTARFSVIADLVREANFWAKDVNADVVSAEYVLEAYENSVHRHARIDEKIDEMISEGTLIIDTEGSKVGEINGLAVYGVDHYAFGKPSKITANVSAGSAGIINIEREAKLSGKSHDKGVLILSGCLREKFGQQVPLSFSASICFEQSYSGVDGDSASSTEIYALLSALSEIPLKQSIAVTGSVNQKGLIQPIGGVNEKIEGFYKVCKKRGLDGSHGVIIPIQNLKDLMLDKEIIEAVKKKKFSIYSVSTIEEGIEILTGVKAGKKTKSGKWETNSVYYYVNKKFAELYKKVKPQEKAKAGRKTKSRPKTRRKK
ncbi:MAG: AAA family ATPase [Bacteroidetes bacterium]|nr:AAA family ATPase [Bacteroidota bacterium]